MRKFGALGTGKSPMRQRPQPKTSLTSLASLAEMVGQADQDEYSNIKLCLNSERPQLELEQSQGHSKGWNNRDQSPLRRAFNKENDFSSYGNKNIFDNNRFAECIIKEKPEVIIGNKNTPNAPYSGNVFPRGRQDVSPSKLRGTTNRLQEGDLVFKAGGNKGMNFSEISRKFNEQEESSNDLLSYAPTLEESRPKSRTKAPRIQKQFDEDHFIDVKESIRQDQFHHKGMMNPRQRQRFETRIEEIKEEKMKIIRDKQGNKTLLPKVIEEIKANATREIEEFAVYLFNQSKEEQQSQMPQQVHHQRKIEEKKVIIGGRQQPSSYLKPTEPQFSRPSYNQNETWSENPHMPMVESEYPHQTNEIRQLPLKTGSPTGLKLEPQPTKLVRGLQLNNSNDNNVNTVIASVKEISLEFSKKQNQIVQELQRKKEEEERVSIQREEEKQRQRERIKQNDLMKEMEAKRRRFQEDARLRQEEAQRLEQQRIYRQERERLEYQERLRAEEERRRYEEAENQRREEERLRRERDEREREELFRKVEEERVERQRRELEQIELNRLRLEAEQRERQEIERQREAERQRQRQIQIEIERQRERERQRQRERERQELRQRQREEDEQMERQRELELLRIQKERQFRQIQERRIEEERRQQERLERQRRQEEEARLEFERLREEERVRAQNQRIEMQRIQRERLQIEKIERERIQRQRQQYQRVQRQIQIEKERVQEQRRQQIERIQREQQQNQRIYKEQLQRQQRQRQQAQEDQERRNRVLAELQEQRRREQARNEAERLQYLQTQRLESQRLNSLPVSTSFKFDLGGDDLKTSFKFDNLFTDFSLNAPEPVSSEPKFISSVLEAPSISVTAPSTLDELTSNALKQSINVTSSNVMDFKFDFGLETNINASRRFD